MEPKDNTSADLKFLTFCNWLIIPITLFFPWDFKSSDNGGAAIAIVFLGFLVFLIFSIYLARKVRYNRSKISRGVRWFAYSPIIFAVSLITIILLSILL
jgi:hypothetical protein